MTENRLTIGLVINPVAGIGGPVALKGSDGKAIVERARSLGSKSQAKERVILCFQHLFEHFYARSENSANPIKVVTYPGEMGASVFAGSFIAGKKALEKEPVKQAAKAFFQCQVLGSISEGNTTADDSRQAVKDFQKQKVDLILFAGGDGTARDICSVVDNTQLVLGIPCGVKMHSGVFANNPEAAARVIIEMVEGRLVSAVDAEVRDIDEEAFRKGQVKARYFGTMLVPEEIRYLQQVKSGGKEVEDIVVLDIAADIIGNMAEDTLYFIGSGTTTAVIMDQLGLRNTLLGVDVIKGRQLLVSDAREDQLYAQAETGKVKLIITVIGGQGHILGRGNQQLSPRILRKIGKDNIIVIASKSKLEDLDGRPLLLDTGDEALDHELAGFIRVVTGYEDSVIYRLES